MLSIEKPVPDISCFHAQQCAEKCLKAFLCSRGADVPRTHDLARLLEGCIESDPSFGELGQHARELTDYAVETRYPDDWSEIPFEEAEDAVREAGTIAEFVRGRLSEE